MLIMSEMYNMRLCIQKNVFVRGSNGVLTLYIHSLQDVSAVKD